MRPTALVPVTAMPLEGQEFFHWTEARGTRRAMILTVYDTTGQCRVLFAAGSPYPQLVQIANLYTVV